MIFKLLPDTAIRWREVCAGAGATAGLFFVGKLVIGLYLGRSGLGAAYGAAGWVILVLAWVYYSSPLKGKGRVTGGLATSPRSRHPRA